MYQVLWLIFYKYLAHLIFINHTMEYYYYPDFTDGENEAKIYTAYR